jgi:hypothetical protein
VLAVISVSTLVLALPFGLGSPVSGRRKYPSLVCFPVCPSPSSRPSEGAPGRGMVMSSSCSLFAVGEGMSRSSSRCVGLDLDRSTDSPTGSTSSTVRSGLCPLCMRAGRTLHSVSMSTPSPVHVYRLGRAALVSTMACVRGVGGLSCLSSADQLL